MRVVRLRCVGFEVSYKGGVFHSNPRAELHALAEQNPSLTKEAAKRLGVERVYEDHRDVLRLLEVDHCYPRNKYFSRNS